jgi:hypothetical protein
MPQVLGSVFREISTDSTSRSPLDSKVLSALTCTSVGSMWRKKKLASRSQYLGLLSYCTWKLFAAGGFATVAILLLLSQSAPPRRFSGGSKIRGEPPVPQTGFSHTNVSLAAHGSPAAPFECNQMGWAEVDSWKTPEFLRHGGTGVQKVVLLSQYVFFETCVAVPSTGVLEVSFILTSQVRSACLSILLPCPFHPHSTLSLLWPFLSERLETRTCI